MIIYIGMESIYRKFKQMIIYIYALIIIITFITMTNYE